MTGRDGVVCLALHLLPTLGPEPRLDGWYCNMRTKNDLAVSFEHFNLCPRLVQAKMTSNGGGNSNETTTLDRNKGRRITHDCSLTVKQSYCKRECRVEEAQKSIDDLEDIREPVLMVSLKVHHFAWFANSGQSNAALVGDAEGWPDEVRLSTRVSWTRTWKMVLRA